MPKINIVSVSGGKDSTATYLLAMEYLGDDFIPIFADTGNEHPVTVNYVKNLHFMTGGPEVVMVNADFKKPIRTKRRNLAKKALQSSSREEYDMFLRRARRLRPTGKPFHDLIMWKGRAPSTRAQFCTEHLKLWPILFYLENKYPRKEYEWEMFTGIRQGESDKRSKILNPFVWNDFFHCWNTMPLLYEDVESVYGLHDQYGVELNPLYTKGKAARVGCYPCIHSSKEELRNLEDWAWDKLEEFEEMADGRTWFDPNTVPGVHITPIKAVKEWVQTSRGGRQYNIFVQNQLETKENIPSCMSGFMKCE